MTRENMRQESRQQGQGTCAICWRAPNGAQSAAQAQLINSSTAGIGLRSGVEIPPSTVVFVETHDGRTSGYGVVRHCSRTNGVYTLGIELEENARQAPSGGEDGFVDFYEFLQISPKAEPATISRVYRYMANRFHPDNPETGDAEKFLQLKEAYETLSDTERRAAYDACYQRRQVAPDPIFESSAFVNDMEGEMNRRLGILSVLYQRRRVCPHNPRVSLFDLEQRMAFPREYLDFATWYLKSKGYVTVQDNSDFELTVLGVDYVESNAQSNPLLHRLLTSGMRTATDSPATTAGRYEPVAVEIRRLGPCVDDLPTNGKSA